MVLLHDDLLAILDIDTRLEAAAVARHALATEAIDGRVGLGRGRLRALDARTVDDVDLHVVDGDVLSLLRIVEPSEVKRRVLGEAAGDVK